MPSDANANGISGISSWRSGVVIRPIEKLPFDGLVRMSSKRLSALPS